MVNRLFNSKEALATRFRVAASLFSTLMLLLALLGFLHKGLALGHEFTGGYLTEISTAQPITQESVSQSLNTQGIDNVIVSSDDSQTRWTLRHSEPFGQDDWLSSVSAQLQTKITLMDSIFVDSQVGAELTEQGGLALITASIVVLVYLWIQFEWRLALGSLTAIVHDVIVVLGIFSWWQIPINLAVIAALLAIIGYSLNDSIVIGDRIRELLRPKARSSLSLEDAQQEQLVSSVINQSITSTLTRTLITSGTTLVTIGIIGIFASAVLWEFALALFLGVVVGSLSSIALSATIPEWCGLRPRHFSDSIDDEIANFEMKAAKHSK